MRVARLPIDPGPAAWNALLPAQARAQVLDNDLTVDWLVIGAGFAGLAAARRLRQLDPRGRIVVLEARRVAEGPAGRNSGFMVDLPHDLTSDDYGGNLDNDRSEIALNRHAIGFAQSMAEEFGLSAEAFAQSGKVNGAATDKGDRHNRDYARHLDALGEAYETLDSGAMVRITGSQYYRSGLFTPGCAVIQPALFVRGVADGLRAGGVKIFENSPVTALTRKGDWVAETPGGRVTAPKVILAVNGHLSSFGHYADRLMHVFTFGSMTRALSAAEVSRLGGEAIWGITPADPLGTTVRRLSGTGGDRIVVRHTFTFDPSLEVSPAKLARITAKHDRSFAARFPMLGGVEMAYRWGGRLCLSRNNVQAVREVEHGLYSACCQNGLGTAKGTLAGLCAAEIAADQPSDIARELMGQDLPDLVPRGPLAKFGANAYLRFKEWQSGGEL